MLQSPRNKWIALILVVLILGSLALIYRYNTEKSLDYSEADISNTPTSNALLNEKRAMLVHIAGAVYRPGVYEVTQNVRVMDILKLAGGPLPHADLDGINLAAKVKDGQKIKVPEIKTPSRGHHSSTLSPKGVINEPASTTSAFPVHISIASEEELMTIPGIGPGLARTIISFRTSQPWSNLDDFKKIKGLGKKKWEKIKPYIEL